ncbi:MAG: pilus assembly protein HicB [Spirochaetae bacterium HGW-Spirochaetae-7]|jgi:predicted RNase H-like HicB family nuclease|nr:MAG: pilus assembly protein HicB [Spirochaetae bacterium HGW-Spirochaetae-7]
MKIYLFPAFFRRTDSGTYSADFPDLPGCVSAGSTLEEIFAGSRESLSLHLYGMLEDGNAIPDACDPQGIVQEPGAFIALVEGHPDMIRDELRSRSVKKTLTIPAWINEEGERRRINFSQVLQEALRERLGV